jgi:hypothetical protein
MRGPQCVLRRKQEVGIVAFARRQERASRDLISPLVRLAIAKDRPNGNLACGAFFDVNN